MSRNVEIVDQEIADMFSRMTPRHIALLVAKILHPDEPIIELAKQMWPTISAAHLKTIVNEAKLKRVVDLIRARPWVMSKIMAGKLAPVMVATLFDLSQSADKDNVRATAAKELIRLAQSTANSLQIGDIDDIPTDALDKAVQDAEDQAIEEAEFLLGPGAEETTDDPESVFTNDT